MKHRNGKRRLRLFWSVKHGEMIFTFLLIGAGCVILGGAAITESDGVELPVKIGMPEEAAAGVLFFGFIVLLIGLVCRLPEGHFKNERRLLKRGVTGKARVLSVRDTGKSYVHTMRGMTGPLSRKHESRMKVVSVRARINIPGMPSWEAETEVLDRQPISRGAVLRVKSDPKDPQKFVPVWE